jgi:hypothetical protein
MTGQQAIFVLADALIARAPARAHHHHGHFHHHFAGVASPHRN